MIQNLGVFQTILQDEGGKPALQKTNDYLIGRVLPKPVGCRFLKKMYPIPNDFHRYEHPPDPFTLLWVSPEEIQQFSGRDYPPYHGKNARLGVVLDGDWDKKPEKINPRYEPRTTISSVSRLLRQQVSHAAPSAQLRLRYADH